MRTQKITYVFKTWERLRDEVKIPYRRQHTLEGFKARRDKRHFASKTAMMRHIFGSGYE